MILLQSIMVVTAHIVVIILGLCFVGAGVGYVHLPIWRQRGGEAVMYCSRQMTHTKY